MVFHLINFSYRYLLIFSDIFQGLSQLGDLIATKTNRLAENKYCQTELYERRRFINTLCQTDALSITGPCADDKDKIRESIHTQTDHLYPEFETEAIEESSSRTVEECEALYKQKVSIYQLRQQFV